jgi:hypothetical protein
MRLRGRIGDPTPAFRACAFRSAMQSGKPRLGKRAAIDIRKPRLDNGDVVGACVHHASLQDEN